MSNKVQISKSLLDGFWWLLDALEGYELDKTTKTVCKLLQDEIEAKYEALNRRASFSAYKSAPPESEERDIRRKAYLDQVGIHKDWRTEKEISSSL